MENTTYQNYLFLVMGLAIAGAIFFLCCAVRDVLGAWREDDNDKKRSLAANDDESCGDEGRPLSRR